MSIRVLQVSVAIAWCLFAAGPVFGYAALKPVLIAEGVYNEKCQDSFCKEQDLSLNFLFALACIVTNVSALPVGKVLDTHGPKVAGILGAIILAFGSLSLSTGYYLAGYSLLALGGPFTFISSFHLANTYPNHSGLILALLTGAFDSSSALFLAYRVVYFKWSKIHLSLFFKGYLIIPVFIFACQWLIMPANTYKMKGEEQHVDSESETTSLITGEEGSLSRVLEEGSSSGVRRGSFLSHQSAGQAKKSSGIYGILHGYSASSQLKSSWFILLTIFVAIQMLRINYFVATIKTQQEYLYGDEDTAIYINHIFDIALPLGGVIAIPFIGLILDNLSTLTVLIILLSVTLTVGVLGLLSYLPATIFGIFLLVVYRPFYYTAISHIFSVIFGYENFGVVYGSAIAISGGCNILQQLLDDLTKNYYENNPIPINIMLTLITGVTGGLLIAFVKNQQIDVKRQNLEIEAEEAYNVDIPT